MMNPIYQRGQLFSGGVKVALASALVVGGFHLVVGNNVLRTAAYTLGTFGAVVFLAWCVELLLGSSLERVTADRATQYRREYEPVGGAAFESTRPLLGGPNAPEMVPASFFAAGGQAVKGRTLDLTLPAESAAAGATARDPLAAAREAAAAVATSLHPGANAATLGTPSAAVPQLPSGDHDFQDLSSLLRGSAPAPAAVAPGGAVRPAGQ